MKSEKRHLDIEELFRQKLENAEVIPSASVSANLMKRLARREFLRFNPSSFNIYYLGLITAGLITAGVLVFSGDDADESKQDDTQQTTEMPEAVAVPPDRNEAPVAGKREARESGIITTETQKPEVVTNEPVNAEVAEQPKNNVIVPEIVNGAPSSDIQLKSKDIPTIVNSTASSGSALFLPSTVSGCAPLKIHFSNLAESYTSFSWKFGDGGVSTKREPDWIYDDEGDYVAVLKATDAAGKISTWSVPITVYSRPKAKFEITPEKAVLPIDEIRFLNLSTGATSYEWDFGDGASSSSFEPVHKYLKYGRYNVSLVAMSEKGCSDTLVIKNAFSGSDYFIKMPNAFIPNTQGPSGGFYSAKSDESAEIFHPSFSGVTEYQLRIFSKTGMLLFESNDINIGWDGYYKGQLCNPGVYAWKIKGNFSNGEPFTKMGDVTLLKN